jgi:hypothetical protein
LFELIDEYSLRWAIIYSFLHGALEIGGYVRGNDFSDIIAHFEDVRDTVGAEPTTRAQISINPYLHRKLLNSSIGSGQD